MRRPSQTAKLGASVGLVASGTASSLLSKILYQLGAQGADGTWHHFEKPWFSTFMMFVGMALCLPAVPLLERLYKALETGVHRISTGLELSEPLLPEQPAAVPPPPLPEGRPGLRSYLLILMPTCFDLVATLLMSVGLLVVSASVYVMLRGSEVLFTAAFSFLFMRRRLNRLHLAGLALCAVGITAVGAASMLSGSGGGDLLPLAGTASPARMLLGMCLIVGAEAIQAAQVVAEEHFMHDLKLQPLTVVGFEGIWGSLLVGGVMLPLAAILPGSEGQGTHEDSRDTLAMLGNSRELQAACAATVFLMGIYNIVGMLVTDNLGALTRTVLEMLRTLAVWLADLALWYRGPCEHGARLGEPWTPASWLQALGFAVLVVGTLVYSHGEEREHAALKARARAHWEQAVRLLQGRPPVRRARIAGPARIRATYLQRLFLDSLEAMRRASGVLRDSAATVARLSARSASGGLPARGGGGDAAAEEEGRPAQHKHEDG